MGITPTMETPSVGGSKWKTNNSSPLCPSPIIVSYKTFIFCLHLKFSTYPWIRFASGFVAFDAAQESKKGGQI